MRVLTTVATAAKEGTVSGGWLCFAGFAFFVGVLLFLGMRTGRDTSGKTQLTGAGTLWVIVCLVAAVGFGVLAFVT